MGIRDYNREAWDRKVERGNEWTVPAGQNDMADLSVFPDGGFDLVFHPVSNLFVPEVRPVWAEAFRVLRLRGSLLAGFPDPAVCIFELELVDSSGEVQV